MSSTTAQPLLEGRTAVVTGGAQGIGFEIARSFVDAGAKVVLGDLNLDAAQAAADKLGGRDVARAVKCNVVNGDEVDALLAEAVDGFGSLDVLVNNAGITRDNLFMRMSDEEWAQVLEVNLTSSFRLARGVLRGMMKARWGRIVSITSVVGQTGNPGQGNYAAAKAGLVGMSKSLAYEVASRGITVNCVAPGFIETPMTGGLTDEQKSRILGQIPAGRMGNPDEIAAAVLYLSSPQAAYVTGATLHVNGGMAMV